MIGIDFVKGAYGKLQGRMGSKKFNTVAYIVMDHMVPDCSNVAEIITETIETEAV